MRTNSFVCTVCRFADGTPSRRALRSAYEAVLYSFIRNSILSLQKTAAELNFRAVIGLPEFFVFLG